MELQRTDISLSVVSIRYHDNSVNRYIKNALIITTLLCSVVKVFICLIDTLNYGQSIIQYSAERIWIDGRLTAKHKRTCSLSRWPLSTSTRYPTGRFGSGKDFPFKLSNQWQARQQTAPKSTLVIPRRGTRKASGSSAMRLPCTVTVTSCDRRLLYASGMKSLVNTKLYV